MASEIYMDDKNTNIYACSKPSKISKNELNAAGIIGGMKIYTSSMMMKPASMLPKRRKDRDNVRMP